MNYDALFEPCYIGSLKVKNRFVVPAMDSHYTNEQHHFTQQAYHYYGERAKGEFGLIITEFICVSEEGLAERTQAAIYSDEFIPTLKGLVDAVHQNNSYIFAQLQHSGRLQGKNTTSLCAVGASSIPDKGNIIPVHELSTDEVKCMIQKFVDGASRAQQAGFDGVEIHGAHGYLLAQFLSKGVNKRVDMYGGNITNRARIVVEIIQGIKKKCGKNFPVVVRTSGDECYVGGNSIEDAVAQAKAFEKAGADAIHISHGIAIHPYYTPSGFNVENVKRVKEALSIPVIGVGRINDPTLALSIIESQSADFVALGRQSICDPHFPLKIKEERLNEIFTCTGCLQRCLYTNTFEEGFGTSCMINPFSGKEGIWTIKKTQENKKIGIVGAGVAGLQCAWILAKRGYEVDVYEKDMWAGGQYRLAAVPSMKQDLSKTVSTYLSLCEKYGVHIHYGIEVDSNFLEEKQLDEVIIATGAIPVVPSIQGIHHDNVFLAQDILSFKQIWTQQNVLVLGAGLVGCETAEILAEYQNQVTVVDMLENAAPQAPKRTRLGLLKHLEELNVHMQLGCRVQSIEKDGITYENNQEVYEMHGFDKIVLAFGSKSNNLLEHHFDNKHIHVIGDAKQAGDAKKAILEATQLALEL